MLKMSPWPNHRTCDYRERHVTVVSMQASFHVFHFLFPLQWRWTPKEGLVHFIWQRVDMGDRWGKFYCEAWTPTYLYKGHSQLLDQAWGMACCISGLFNFAIAMLQQPCLRYASPTVFHFSQMLLRGQQWQNSAWMLRETLDSIDHKDRLLVIKSFVNTLVGSYNMETLE